MASAHSNSMKEPKAPYTTFMMPARHHDMNSGVRHYTIPKAIDSTEIDRRETLLPGTLNKERQHMGAMIQRWLLNIPFENPNEIDYVTKWLSVADVNTNLYESAQGKTEVMNRTAPMPIVADDKAQWRQTPEGIWLRAQAQADHAENMAGRLEVSHAADRVPLSLSAQTGRAFGGIGLTLANVSFVRELPAHLNAFDASLAVRSNGQNALELARTSAEIVGEPVSINAIADRDSMSMAYMRRNAPTLRVRSALEQAVEEFGSAA
jgi:hypothetical protein